MKGSRDFGIVHHINLHVEDLKEDLASLDSVEAFVASKQKRRAALFDFLQIGELLHQLSKSFLADFNDPDTEKIISIRNRIVHGYADVNDAILFVSLTKELLPFVEKLNAFARERYSQAVKSFLGKEVEVIVDRPIGHCHKGIEYRLNYGYCEDLIALDGEFQDAYVLETTIPAERAKGTVVAIIHRQDDIEDKLVVSPSGIRYSAEEIEQRTSFQESFFAHVIVTLK